LFSLLFTGRAILLFSLTQGAERVTVEVSLVFRTLYAVVLTPCGNATRSDTLLNADVVTDIAHHRIVQVFCEVILATFTTGGILILVIHLATP
jgi:hypothetical protein